MKSISHVKHYAAALGLALVGSGAYAQIPVTDVASLTQQIQQVLSWAQQYQQMVDQYKNMEAQLRQQTDTVQALTGNKNMSGVASNMVRQELPNDFLQTYDKIRQMGAGGASQSAKQIYNTVSTYRCSDRFPNNATDRRNCEASSMMVPQNIDLLNTSVKSSQNRMGQIQGLMSAVDSTSDAKAAVDLQNRIGVEVAYLQNEKMMMDLAAQQQQAQMALQRQATSEAGAKRLTIGGGSTNPFAQ